MRDRWWVAVPSTAGFFICGACLGAGDWQRLVPLLLCSAAMVLHGVYYDRQMNDIDAHRAANLLRLLGDDE